MYLLNLVVDIFALRPEDNVLRAEYGLVKKLDEIKQGAYLSDDSELLGAVFVA